MAVALIDKWTIYKHLYKFTEVDIFLPQTAYVTKPEVVFDMLNCYKSVFVKPCLGHGGLYIMHIHKLKRDTYKIYYYKKDEIYSSTLSHIEMETILLKQIYTKKCIVQRDIKLAKHHGRLTMIHVRVQKSCDGIWRSSTISAKLAAKNSTITSLDMGGTIISYNELQLCSRIDKELTKFELIDISINSAKCLEKLTDYSYSYSYIWNVDLAIDYCGGLWFIDASY